MDGLLGRIALTSTLALAVGCSDGGGSGGVPEYSSVPQADAGRTLGHELCRLMLDQCDCPRTDEIFGTFAECTDATSMQLDQYFEEAQAAGLTYHPECMADHINLYTRSIQCLTIDELLNDAALMELNAPSCKVHSGDGQEGDSCTNYYQALGDTCAQGLRCFDVCTAIPDELVVRQEGEACDLQTEACVAGTACQAPPDDLEGATTCVRLPGAGEPCTIGCAEGLNCDLADDTATERTCLTPPGAGEPCGSFPNPCGTDLYCEADVCTATLTEGTACQDDEQCGEGQVCDQLEDGGEDVCMIDSPLVCIG